LALGMSDYYHPVDVYNRMLGSVRIRQSRVKLKDDCQVGPLFAEYRIKCYPPLFFPADEDTAPFGPDLKFGHSTDDGGSTYAGSLGMYPPSGYMVSLPMDSQGALDKIKELRDGEFLGPWTRCVFIDLVVWSPNINTYSILTVMAEFGPGGGVVTHTALLSMSNRMLRAGGGFTDPSDIASLCLLILVLIFVVAFIAEELREIKKSGSDYFRDGWNILDWINMLLLLVGFGMRVFIWSEAAGMEIGQAQLSNPSLFPSFRSFAQVCEMVKLLNAINAVLLFGKCTKYLRHIPVIKELVRVLWKALDLFVPFFVMLFVAFLGFGMAYSVAFGDRIWELSSLGSALVYLCRAFVRDVTLMPVYAMMPQFGAAMILMFYIIFLLLGVNILFAIIADAMFRHKYEAQEGKDENNHEDEPVEEFFREIRRRWRAFLKRRFPKLYKRIYRRKKKRVEEQDGDKAPNPNGDFVLPEDSDDESVNSFAQDKGPALPTKDDLMRSIEHMSGRILSEMSIVGIEIQSELHDVCERVAQMQMAVEELSMRADGVRLDQEDFLKDPGDE